MTEYNTICDYCGDEIEEGGEIVTVECGVAEFNYIGGDKVLLNQGSEIDKVYHLNCAKRITLLKH